MKEHYSQWRKNVDPADLTNWLIKDGFCELVPCSDEEWLKVRVTKYFALNAHTNENSMYVHIVFNPGTSISFRMPTMMTDEELANYKRNVEGGSMMAYVTFEGGSALSMSGELIFEKIHITNTRLVVEPPK